ncbi:hypothetical protein QYF36_023249 [Acer negundo]|nr:hypothetical protein QYF36_023249 [Acer negundo]
MDGVYSSEEKQRSNIIPKEEDNDGSYGGTRSDPTMSSTFEQAGPWKEKENDHIKNRQEDILEDHHKAVQKSEYNHGIDRDKGNHGVTRHGGILEDHHKAVHKPKYNHGLDLTKKESSSPDSGQASVQKRRGKQGINTNDEYTNLTNPLTKGFSHASIQ